MQTSDRTALEKGSLLQYVPVAEPRRLPLREAGLLIFYHLRLLNWWLFLLMFLGFLGSCVLLWFQLRVGGSLGSEQATQLSRFVMESGAGLLAAILSSSLVVGDPLLEVMIATRPGLRWVVVLRFLLTFFILLFCSAIYLAWSLGNGISYAHQQSPLFLLLVWLAPVLVMSMLGLLGSLATRNAALGMTIATTPLAGALFLNPYLLPIQATHPFFIPYTSWGQDAADWWINRLTLLGLALVFAACIWWWLRREERRLGDLR